MRNKIAVGLIKIRSEKPTNKEGTPGTIMVVETGGADRAARLYIKCAEKWKYIDLEDL